MITIEPQWRGERVFMALWWNFFEWVVVYIILICNTNINKYINNINII